MFAKKEYELIASVIRNLPNRPSKEQVAEHFANRLGFDNPRFDRDKFLKVCDVATGYNPVGEAIEFFSGSKAETEG